MRAIEVCQLLPSLCWGSKSFAGLNNHILSPTRYLGTRTFGYLIAARSIQDNARDAVKCQFTTVQITVPWGKIEGKLWGSSQKQPILALHGLMENAGSFDQLAPLLNNSSILAVDLPGNGYSSWLPPGAPYGDVAYLETLRLIARHFGWERMKLLGHSMGGVLCQNYARVDPVAVEFVIAIDWLPVVTYLSYNLERRHKQLRESLDRLIEMDERLATSEPTSYPEPVVLKRWMEAGVFGTLDPSVARTLMIRGTRRNDDGRYCYTRDPRQKVTRFLTCYTTEEAAESTGKVDCPYLIIENPRTPMPSEMRQLCRKNIIDVLARSSRDFRLVSLDGEHHMHMIEPQVVANEIKPFLNKYDV